MKFFMTIGISFLLTGPLSSVQAADLQPGLYEVSVKVALPNLTETAHELVKRVCLTEEKIRGKRLFEILSDNPLAQCAYETLSLTKKKARFQIQCPGRSAAHATGQFEKTTNGFRGQISMNMGGKNMTIIERQKGQLVGPCERHN